MPIPKGGARTLFFKIRVQEAKKWEPCGVNWADDSVFTHLMRATRHRYYEAVQKLKHGRSWCDQKKSRKRSENNRIVSVRECCGRYQWTDKREKKQTIYKVKFFKHPQSNFHKVFGKFWINSTLEPSFRWRPLVRNPGSAAGTCI